MDKLGFKYLMIGLLCMELVISSTIFFSVKNTGLYLTENFLVAMSLSGTFTMITPEFGKNFGKKGASIYGITGMLIGISSFLGPVLTKILVKDLNDYLVVYLAGGGAIVLNIILLTYYKEPKKEKLDKLEPIESDEYDDGEQLEKKVIS